MDQLKIDLRNLYTKFKTTDTIFGEEDCNYLMSQLMNELKAYLRYPCVQELYNKNLLLLDEYRERHLFKGMYYNLLKDLNRLIGV